MHSTFIKLITAGAFVMVLSGGVPLAHAASLTDSQIQAIVSLLQSFNIDQVTITNVQAVLNGKYIPSSTTTTSACIDLSANLYPDVTDALSDGQISKLQQFLALDASIYPEGRVTGYFGPATLAAVQRWQKSHALVSSGDPDTTGYGFVGPKTRAALSCNSASTATTPAVRTPAATTGSTTPSIVTTTSTSTPPLVVATTTQQSCVVAGLYWYTVSCHPKPAPAESCAASYTYCSIGTECSANGWYSCRGSCYGSVDACLGQTYTPPTSSSGSGASVATTSVATTTTTTTTTTVTPAAETTPPSAPTNFTATAASSYSYGAIDFSWLGSTDSGSSNIAASGYKVYRDSAVIATIFSIATLAHANTISFTSGEDYLQFSTTYTYYVVAYDAAGNVSAPSNSASATTQAPPALSDSGCTGLTLTFANNKTTYTQGETVTYTYTCTPSGSASYVEIQLLKPDGTTTTYNSASGSIQTQTLGFGTSNAYTSLAPGDYTLRACLTANCAPTPTVSAPFSIISGPTSTAAPAINKSLASFPRNLTLGSIGSDVKQLQTLLVAEVGYAADLITGYFGAITRDAVKRLQEKYSVSPAFGYFGEITRKALTASVSNW